MHRMPQLDAVIFDYGQTLVTFTYPREDLLSVLHDFEPTIEEVLGGPAPPPDVLLDRVLMPLERHVSSESEEEVDWLEVYRDAWHRVGLALPDGLLYEILDAEQKCWDRIVVVDPHASDLLLAIRHQGLKTAVCSNAPFPPEMLRRQLASNGIGALMDAAIFSSAVGRRKPAREMYAAALEAVGARADRALFVGNRVREDYTGPVAFGIRAVICTAHNQEPTPAAIPSIDTLAGVLRLL
jgi:FMN phosphatase YigB (HAD superfamily)